MNAMKVGIIYLVAPILLALVAAVIVPDPAILQGMNLTGFGRFFLSFVMAHSLFQLMAFAAAMFTTAGRWHRQNVRRKRRRNKLTTTQYRV